MNNIRITNNNITYRAVGRYMAGSTVTGYHLVGSDGRQGHATKSYVVYMIGKGLIENMRVQASGTDMIIRGKGVNLNNLPVYDENKNRFRNDEASQNVEKSAVKPRGSSGINPMGQLKLVKRIMQKTTCQGYVVVDHSGKEFNLSRKSVLELALKRLVSNATVQKYNKPGEDKTRLILRGAGCELKSLPSVIVDRNGKIIDPEKNTGEMRVRAVRMKRGGIVHNKKNDKKVTFEPGDYIVCKGKGGIVVIKSEDMSKYYEVDKESKDAICDEFVENVANYPIELFGTKARELSPKQVLNWAILKPKVKQKVGA